MAGDDLLDGRASLAPPPWTPEVGALLRVHGQHVASAAVMGTLGLAVLAAYLLTADESFAETAVFLLVCFAVYWLASHAWDMVTVPGERRDPIPRSLDSTAPVPLEAPVRPWFAQFAGSPLRACALVGLLALLVLMVVVLDEDGTAYVVLFSASSVHAAEAFRRGRTIGRWQQEHGVELLRPLRRGSGAPAYYVRKRS